MFIAKQMDKLSLKIVGHDGDENDNVNLSDQVQKDIRDHLKKLCKDKVTEFKHNAMQKQQRQKS